MTTLGNPVQQAAEKTVQEKDEQSLRDLKVRHSDLTRMRDGHLAQAQNLVGPLNDTMQQMATIEQRLYGDKPAKQTKAPTKKK